MILPNLVSNTQSIANDTVYAENKVKYTAPIILGSSFLGLLISFGVAPKLGAVGCAASTCLALVIYVVLVNRFYYRKLKIEIGRFFRECQFRITSVMLISIVAGVAIKFFFPISGWGSLFFAAGIYGVIYLINAYFLAFNNEEKRLVTSLFKPF